MNEVRSEVQKLQQATLERLSNVEQTVDRLDSNIDTQRKYFSKEIGKAQMAAEIAFNQSAENRQSINAISEYSGRSAEFMNSLMDRLTNLRFELPNALDQWATMRFGHQEGPSTVTASQLHHPPIASSANHIPAPRLQLPIINFPGEPQQQSTTDQQSTIDPGPQSTQSSPDKQLTRAVWKEFINTQSSSSGDDIDMVPPGNEVKLDESDQDGWPKNTDVTNDMKTDVAVDVVEAAHRLLETVSDRERIVDRMQTAVNDRERMVDRRGTNTGGVAESTADGDGMARRREKG